MATATCKNGHIYDNSLYSSCPYCDNGQTVLDFSPTMGVAGAAFGADNGQTQAPLGYESPAGYQGTSEPGGRDVLDDDRTRPPRDYRKQKVTDDCKTEAVINKKVNAQAQPDLTTPVVGWVICIEGPEAGRDYRVYGKRNTVGRNDGMDISVKKDMAISGDTHAWLNYDYKHNTFRLAPGNSDNYTYVNDEPLDNAITLKPYDLIEMGESKFVFIPLCGPRFDWINGLKHKEEHGNGMA